MGRGGFVAGPFEYPGSQILDLVCGAGAASTDLLGGCSSCRTASAMSLQVLSSRAVCAC